MEQLTRSVRYLAFAALAVLLTGVTPAAQGRSTGQGGPQEGIKVHGHWVIDVRNPDGTLASRRELQNALDTNADRLLAELLNGDLSAGHWFVMFGQGTLCNPNGSPCTIAEAGSGSPNANLNNLTAVVPATGPNAKKLVLSGSIKVSTAGEVLQVSTGLTTCPGSISPASCIAPNAFGFFTSKFVEPTIPVQANQTIDITVVISFS